jgi:hypothetical protein
VRLSGWNTRPARNRGLGQKVVAVREGRDVSLPLLWTLLLTVLAESILANAPCGLAGGRHREHLLKLLGFETAPIQTIESVRLTLGGVGGLISPCWWRSRPSF